MTGATRIVRKSVNSKQKRQEIKKEQEAIRLAVQEGKFISVEQVTRELTRKLANLKKSMLAMGHLVASNLASLDMEAAEIAKAEVDKRVKEALTEMAEGRLYRGRTKKKEK